MFAPMMLPTDSEDCFLRMAVMVVTSSGSDVPMAIMVAPMMASGNTKHLRERDAVVDQQLRTEHKWPQRQTRTTDIERDRPAVRLGAGICSVASSDCSRRAETRLSAIKHTKMTRIKTLSRMDSCPSRVKPNRTAIAAKQQHRLDRILPPRHGALHTDQRQAHDQAGIGRHRADGVADGDVRIALQRGKDGTQASPASSWQSSQRSRR